VSRTVDTVERITELLRATVSMEVSSPDLDLIESGMLDSLAFVEILLGIEDEFGVDVRMGGFQIDDFRTVSKIADFVERKTGA
jgi:D-alanine--poly(phosphoribitol) ligase subunit 2